VTGSATALKTTGAAVNVSASAPPAGPGYGCITTDATHCTWQQLTGGSETFATLIIGDDPGGSQPFRVGGAGYFDGLLTANSGVTCGGTLDMTSQSIINVSTLSASTIDGGGSSLSINTQGGTIDFATNGSISNLGTLTMKGAAGNWSGSSGDLTVGGNLVVQGTSGIAVTGAANVSVINSSAGGLKITSESADDSNSGLEVYADAGARIFRFVGAGEALVGTMFGNGDTGILGKLAVGSTTIGAQTFNLTGTQGITGQFTSTLATGTAPLVIASTTPVANLTLATTAQAGILSGVTGSIGGGLLTVGNCASGTASVTGAVVGSPVAVSASDGTLPNALAVLSASVTSTNVVGVQVCAIGTVTPASKTYNVRVVN